MKKRIVSFLLALVMAVSLLPVSAFAADGAYHVAKDTTVQQGEDANIIAVQAATEPEQINGFYQIKTADDLVWFRDYVNSNGYNKGACAQLLADIDLSKSGNWRSIATNYAGVFDGQGHTISGLSLVQSNAARNVGYGLFSSTKKGARIQNVGLASASVTAYGRGGRGGYTDIQTAALVGINNGTISNCFVVDSTVTVQSKSTPKSGVLCGDNGGTIENCYAINSEILDKSNKTYLGGIAGNNTGTIKNVYSINVKISTTGTTNVHPIAVGTIENAYYAPCSDDTRTFTGGEQKENAWFLTDDAIADLGEKYFAKDTENQNNGYPVLTYYVDDSGSTKANKSTLKALLDAMPTDGYYTQDDRYNGKVTSQEGFWSDYQKLVSQARNVYNQENASQSAVDEAVAKLKDSKTAIDVAIANLIPADRANTTVLYEALQNTSSSNDDTYTAKSWAAYQAARDKAEALMATMFDAEGNPTDDNKAAANETIETMAAELETARKALEQKAGDGTKTIAKLDLEAIRYLAKKYDQDTLTGYTAESVEALRQARAAALKLADELVIADMGVKDYDQLDQALRELRKAAYGLETVSQDKIAVKVSVLDTNDIYAGYTGELAYLHNPNTYTASLTLDANASAYDLLSGKSLLKNRNTAAEAVVFLNGELVYGDLGSTSGYDDMGYVAGSENSTFQAIRLHDKDELTIVWIYPKQVEYSSQAGTYPAYLMDIPDYFRYSTVSAPIEVEAGQPFTVSVTSEAALPFHSAAGTRAVAGVKVYRSDAAESAEAAATGYVGVNTYAVTDESGKATLTLYNEGYVLLNAFRTDTDEARYTVGASVLVHVTAAGDLDAVKQQLREELDAVYNDEQHPESVFTAENWQKVQDAYNTAVAAIDAAKTSGEAGDAQQKAIQTIKKLQSSADYNNKINLEEFRRLLAQLPDDVSKLDTTAADTVAQLKTCYEAMTVYQRGQLTGREQKKYDAIIKAQADGLAPAKQYQLMFQQDYSSVPAADQAALADMIAYLQDNTRKDDDYGNDPGSGIGGNQMAKLFAFSTAKSARYGTTYTQITEAASLTRDIYACINPDYAAYFLCRDAALTAGKKDGPGVITGTGWSISDASMTMYVPDENSSSNTTRVLGHMTYTVNGTQYAVKSVTVSGLETAATKLGAGFYDASNYRGRFTTQCNQVIPDTFLQMTTGFNDVTVTVTWAPVNADSSEAIAAAKTAAKADLAAELAKYSSLFNKNYANIKAAYDKGVAAIDKAATLAEITKAKASALSNMKLAASGGYYGAEIKGWSQGDPFDAGEQVGTVTVSVANFTYDDGYYYRPAGETPFLYKENYPLGKNDTVMTVILRALHEEGYTWNGSTGNDKNKGEDYGITYLSSVSKTENGKTYSLGEFDGGGQSGWMGTLNDWFTNYGFTEFTVKNRSLGDGDYISIQYTQDGLGADLGGTWDNSDTTLKALEIEGGTLVSKFVPGEAGGTYEYTLAIDSDAAEVRLTPTASNKNFLTKIFLNNKVTDNTEGASFYKRTQYIPVTSGDVIYVGCGERAWPSMNNQEGNTQSNDGTWYALRVVNVKGDAGAVNDMIDALPSASAVKYSSYQQFVDAVAAARTVYDTLDDAAKKAVDPAKLAKLEELEKTIEGFQAIDDVKDKLDKLPNAGGLTIDDQEAVKAAQEAYDKLSDEQKEYLSFAQIDKMDELTTRMEEIIKENPTPTPTPGGNTGNNSSAKNPYQKDNGKDVKSGNTGDAGITLYVGMGLVAVLAGAVIVIRKRKEN